MYCLEFCTKISLCWYLSGLAQEGVVMLLQMTTSSVVLAHCIEPLINQASFLSLANQSWDTTHEVHIVNAVDSIVMGMGTTA